MPRLVMLIASLLCLFAVTSSCSGQIPFVRAIYGPWNSSQLAQVGIEARYRQGDWEWGVEWIRDTYSRESLEAAADGIVYIAGQYYDSANVDFEYVRAMNRYGDEEPRTTSPLDESYWSKHIEEGFLFIANLSLHYPIWGIVIDMEPYRSTSKWPTGSYTYDTNSFYGFANETGMEFPEMIPRERYPYLFQRGLIEEYEEWQAMKVRNITDRIERKVHSVNPKLSLGMLWHQDSWLIWSVLDGFNSSFAPITSWTEETYPGYDRDYMMEMNDIWTEHGLNGVLVPGFYTTWVPPFDMIVNMEEALRWDGVLWIYQHGDPYRLADEESYAEAYRVLDRRILFNGSEPDPLPIFDVYPGAEARPYRGPDGVSILLPYDLRFTLDGELDIITDRTEIGYIGRNLTTKSLKHPYVDPKDLPCILFGLDEGDIIRTHCHSMIKEMKGLFEIDSRLSLGGLNSKRESLEIAESRIESGKYEEAWPDLVRLRETAYQRLMDIVWPLYMEGKLSPRNSTIPLSAMNSIFSAHREFSEGDLVGGRQYLWKGFEEWEMAVSEATPVMMVILLVLVELVIEGLNRHLSQPARSS